MSEQWALNLDEKELKKLAWGLTITVVAAKHVGNYIMGVFDAAALAIMERYIRRLAKNGNAQMQKYCREHGLTWEEEVPNEAATE